MLALYYSSHSFDQKLIVWFSSGLITSTRLGNILGFDTGLPSLPGSSTITVRQCPSLTRRIQGHPDGTSVLKSVTLVQCITPSLRRHEMPFPLSNRCAFDRESTIPEATSTRSIWNDCTSISTNCCQVHFQITFPVATVCWSGKSISRSLS